MEWTKKTTSYMWADYYSKCGTWKAYLKSELIESNKTFYNPVSRKFEKKLVYKNEWILENMKTGETYNGFKTLKAAKLFAESK